MLGITNMTEKDWVDIKYFKKSEFNNPDLMQRSTVFLIDEFREFVGASIIINDDARIGSGKSQHYFGKAVDIVIVGLNVLDQYLMAEKFGKFKGIGIYPHWNRPGLHLDNRGGDPGRWLAYKSDDGKQRYTALNSENIKRYVIPII